MLDLLVTSMAVGVAVPVVVLSAECLAALFANKDTPVPRSGPRPRTAVLIPAHDEEGCLSTALESVLPQLAKGDRLIVVAHNCSDGTADVARRAGAEVLEARDDGTRGKPAALEAGLRHLDPDPPEVCVIVDADCRVGEGTVEALARSAAQWRTPVQGVYLFETPQGAGDVSALALRVKNLVRPLGLSRLGLACLLNGAGSAYPFALLREAPHGHGSIAEDYQLSVDLALRGHPTRFQPAAEVISGLPSSRTTAYAQRRRWEHGHLHLVFRTAPRLLARGILERNLTILALGADLCVPPLSFLVLGWLTVTAVSAARFALGGGGGPLGTCVGSGLLLFSSLFLAIWRFAGPRDALALVTAVPRYVLWKVPLYFAYGLRRETRWRKTPRD